MKPFAIITYLIIGLIVLISFLGFLSSYQTGVRDITDKELCKRSVQANALARYDTIGGNSNIDCPTRFIELKTDKDQAVFETLALAMADTWDEFFEGRLEVFKTDTQDYCVVRRVVEFSDKKTYTGFFDYLLQHNPPSIPKPYFLYLTNTEVSEGVRNFKENLALQKLDTIDTATPYAVVFVMAKKQNWGKILSAKVGTITGGTIGVISAGALIYIAPPIGILTSTKLVLGGTGAGAFVGGVTGFIFGSSYPANWDSAIVLIPYTKEHLNSLNCTKLPVKLSQLQ